jgi:hypothetical protein
MRNDITQKYPGITKADVEAMIAEGEKMKPPEPPISGVVSEKETVEQRVAKLEAAAAATPDDTITQKLGDLEKRLAAVEKVKPA